MAQLKLSALVNAVSGKLNGSVAKSTRVGISLQNNKACSKCKTQAQLTIRRHFQRCFYQWSSINQSLKDTWLSSSAFGISGFALYKSLNFWRFYFNLAAFTRPPLPTSPIASNILSLVYNPLIPSVLLTLSPGLASQHYLIVRASAPCSIGAAFDFKKQVIIGTFSNWGATQFDLLPLYLSCFGVFPAGNAKIHFSFSFIYNINMRQSSLQYMSVIIP